MSQIIRHHAYTLIEDRLDAVGQKYRVQRIVRGALLFVMTAVAACFLAALAAHFLGQSRWTYVVVGAWGASLLAAMVIWLFRPLLIRPRAAEVARMVETRVGGLHNSLTNSVLLATASDLQQSPWLGPIFEENLQRSDGKSLDQAVRFSDLKSVALQSAGLIVLVAALMVVPQVRSAIQHGWHQMFNPVGFVPRIGSVEIIDIQPRAITLVNGQPLEVVMTVRDPMNKAPAATLIFNDAKIPAAQIVGTPTDGNLLRYSYRLEHVEQSMKFRAEVGGSESSWCEVTVVRQVKLEGLKLTIDPPPYTNQSRREILLKSEELEKATITVPEGSKVDLDAQFDVPVRGALLQINDAPPLTMELSAAGHHFNQMFTLMQDSTLAVNLTENGQIIATLPNPPLMIHCTKDAPPTIEMKWPTGDTSVPLDQELKIRALLKDDYGVASVRVLMSATVNQPLETKFEKVFTPMTAAQDVSTVLDIPAELRKHGTAIRVQLEVKDNRYIKPDGSASRELGAQTTSSSVYEIKFRDAREIAKQEKEQNEKLRAILMDMLQRQNKMHDQTIVAMGPTTRPAAAPAKAIDKPAIAEVLKGQTELRDYMHQTAESFPFVGEDKVIQKALAFMAVNEAKDAVDFAQAVGSELVDAEQHKIGRDLQARQRRIITGLEKLLALLGAMKEPSTQPTTKQGGDLASDQKEKFEKLKEDLQKFIKEEQRILDQTASLAKKAVDNWDDADKKKLEELQMAQEKMDAFIQQKVNETGKLAEQDMANATLLKEMMEIYSEVTMAKDALKKKAVEIAVPLEESGLELAKEIASNLEKWLPNAPDREKWNLEEPVGKTDPPMAELPKELEDMIGELMEKQEDLFEEMEDATSSWADSMDKGIGWDAADGPIANMSAKGVTGNTLPNDNEMNGRSGEGRSGKSSGEMAEESAQGKGGRPTPTRLDPTPFQKGQIKDTSKDPVGGATGGGKLSGEGGQGLEGPLAPKQKEEAMKRMADKQAQLRNKAERLELKYGVGHYDQFKLLESIALMRRVEADLKANRYNNALRRRDVLVDDLDTSHMLLAGQIHVQHDTTPQTNQKVQEQINDAMKGQLPAAWSEALKEYYKKLSKD